MVDRPLKAETRIQQPPVSTPMNSELYTSLVTSANAIATIGGTSDQNVCCTESAVVVKAATSKTATSATNVTMVPMPNFFFDVDIPSNP